MKSSKFTSHFEWQNKHWQCPFCHQHAAAGSLLFGCLTSEKMVKRCEKRIELCLRHLKAQTKSAPLPLPAFFPLVFLFFLLFLLCYVFLVWGSLEWKSQNATSDFKFSILKSIVFLAFSTCCLDNGYLWQFATKRVCMWQFAAEG